ncbi:NHL domain-containing protein [Nitrospina gracilis]|uniref:NHL domain-containing protein n=1 Tax=Nitrospina gracilis TaxID=35801 RepID=UPI001F1954FE|nr:SMP-30/gluconolactonase/LRE family protein [Nitrospina gracilis]MCF8720500.1 sugar lactone lactonase YvrE [Nitrospina gracilis Nb-211]
MNISGRNHGRDAVIFRWVCLIVLSVVLGGAAFPGEKSFPYSDIGDGQPAIHVALTLVDGVAVDAEGNIFISHRSKNRIRKIGKNGIITTVAGNGNAGFHGDDGPALEAALNFPAGLCLDPEGNLYIADRNNHRVRKVDTEGIITTVAGTGEADFGTEEGPAVEIPLHFPSDVACDSKGHVYISDRSNNRVLKMDPEGQMVTVAGVGMAGYGGDFGPAIDALLKYPFGIHVDENGNLYIADRGNNRVRKVTPDGVIVTVAGEGTHFFSGDFGPATRSSLAYPTDVVTDARGNLYIADRNNNRVRKVDENGIITTVMGTGKNEYNGDNEIASETSLHLPFALAMTPDQHLLIVDRNHHRVRSMDLTQHTVQTVAGNGQALFRGDHGPGPGATLDAPSGIVVDKQGHVIFADKQAHRLRALDKKGYIYTYAGTGREGNEGNGHSAHFAALFMPESLEIDSQDRLYLISSQGNSWYVRRIDENGVIDRFAGSGVLGHAADGVPAVNAPLGVIKDVAAGPDGKVYLADYTNRDIRWVDKQGRIQTLAKEAWLAIEDGEVHPNGLAVNDQGDVFVSDSGSSKIRKVDTEGNVTTYAGDGSFEDKGDGGPALLAGIRSPGGLVFSPSGELYIAEENTHRIRKVDKNGIITTVAGTGVQGFSGDGGPATEAQLKSPYGMAFDKEGNLYFTDRDNNRVRRVDTNGIITTLAGNDNFGWLQDGLEVRITIQNFP